MLEVCRAGWVWKFQGEQAERLLSLAATFGDI